MATAPLANQPRQTRRSQGNSLRRLASKAARCASRHMPRVPTAFALSFAATRHNKPAVLKTSSGGTPWMQSRVARSPPSQSWRLHKLLSSARSPRSPPRPAKCRCSSPTPRGRSFRANMCGARCRASRSTTRGTPGSCSGRARCAPTRKPWPRRRCWNSTRPETFCRAGGAPAQATIGRRPSTASMPIPRGSSGSAATARPTTTSSSSRETASSLCRSARRARARATPTRRT